MTGLELATQSKIAKLLTVRQMTNLYEAMTMALATIEKREISTYLRYFLFPAVAVKLVALYWRETVPTDMIDRLIGNDDGGRRRMAIFSPLDSSFCSFRSYEKLFSHIAVLLSNNE